MSKSGLIHHFRTKDDLISAMLEHFRAQTLRTMEQRIAADENPRGRSFRAMVGMVLQPVVADHVAETAHSGSCRFFTALLAASANNPRLLDSFRHPWFASASSCSPKGPMACGRSPFGPRSTAFSSGSIWESSPPKTLSFSP